MSDLPRPSGTEAKRVFKLAGFVHVRTKGSHHILKKPGHPSTLSIHIHGNKTLRKGLFLSLLQAEGMTVEQFAALQ
jgi:predicted RNA binding protein YcfA (HicA-like mRNA interferase family)